MEAFRKTTSENLCNPLGILFNDSFGVGNEKKLKGITISERTSVVITFA